MTSVSRVLSATAVLCLVARLASADVVAGSDKQYGRIVKIDGHAVSIRPSCDATATVREIAWTDVRYLAFDDTCTPHNVTPPVAGLADCDGQVMTAYAVRFKDGHSLEAVQVAFDGTNIRLERSTAQEWVIAGRSDVATIVRTSRCRSVASHDDSWPATACVEPTQWAVNWSQTPVADNTIFTKGFAIHVVRAPSVPAALTDEDVRLAFQTAVTLWTSALLTHRSELDADLQEYIASITSSSASRYVMLSPPQVIQVACPQLAMSVVRISMDPAQFPAKVVALSQTEGRTISLNAGAFQFFSRLAPQETDPPINLIAVMTHELGHSFGLLDEDGPPEASVMAGVQRQLREMRDPTPADARRFAAVLRQTILGSRPGEFQAVRCAGLRFEGAQ